MKKLLIAVAAGLFLMTTQVQAQVDNKVIVEAKFKSATNLDTVRVVNANTRALTLAPTTVYKNFTAEVKLDKISGTAAGVVTLWYSNSGVLYKRVNTDSLLVTNVTQQGKLFDLGPNKYRYYQFRYTGAGTQSVTLSVLGELFKE